MAHSYQVDAVTVLPGDDLVTLTGSVDGVAVKIQFWKSAIINLTQIQRRAFIAPLMLAAAFPPGQVDGGVGLNGQFIQ